MSRKYQGLIVLNTKSLDGTVDELVASVSKELESEGAKLDKVAQLGRRQFAYESRHLESGHYVNYTFQGAPDVITKIQKRLRLNDHVHLQHFVRVA
ncbi:MAG: 30S ribosomal protein S6 [Luteolibacter sp.]|jgi:small subunit ribosomal protein S6